MVSRASAAAALETNEAQSPSASLDPGKGLTVRSADERYELRVRLQAVYRFEPTYLDGKSQDRVAILSARPAVAGSVVRPWITFLTSAELAGNPPYLLYSYLDVRPVSELGLRFGQQDTPFDRHPSFGLYKVLFPETGPVPGYFWSGRDKGLTAYGSLTERFDYWLGIYAGSPLRQFTTIAGNYVAEGRITVNPLGKIGESEFAYALGDSPAPTRVSFTLQGYVGKVQSATENFDPSTFLLKTTATG
jgi:hypothetical protein